MANNRLIKFYKGYVLQQIHTKLNEDGAVIPVEDVDKLIKHSVDIDMSSVQMSNEELQAVILSGFSMADRIGLKLDYPQDKWDKLIKLNLK
jgi:hypothetical protein